MHTIEHRSQTTVRSGAVIHAFYDIIVGSDVQKKTKNDSKTNR